MYNILSTCCHHHHLTPPSITTSGRENERRTQREQYKDREERTHVLFGREKVYTMRKQSVCHRVLESVHVLRKQARGSKREIENKKRARNYMRERTSKNK